MKGLLPILAFPMICSLLWMADLTDKEKPLSSKPNSPYDTLRYDSVVVYDYNGMSGREIVKNGALVKQEGYRGKIHGSLKISDSKVKWLNKLIGSKSTYGGPTAACFDPHMGVVYYRQAKIVGHFSICIDCNFLRSSHPIPAVEASGMNYGFSKSTRKKINQLCKELEFTTCKDSLRSHLFD